jgi:serine/threonine protein kinase
MTPEVILTNNYDQKCDVFSFSIMMFQILTKKIDNIYENKIIDGGEIELEEVNSNINNIANIELKVANDPNFRPSIPNEFKKNFVEFIDLMKKCWNHNPKERPNFNEITLNLQEIYENVKEK